MDAAFKPKSSRNGAGEVVFSTEETNRVRLALGLRPLTCSADAVLPGVQTVTKNGEISCSVAETNKLRAALGLRPLRTHQSSPESSSAPSRYESKEDGIALERRLQKARAARAARSVMAPLSISEEVAQLETQSEASLSKKKHAAPTKKRKRESLDAVQLPSRLKEELGPGQQAILTLRDKHVLGDDNEPQILQREESSRKRDRHSDDESEDSDIDGMNYDGTDTAQFQIEPKPPKDVTTHNIQRTDMLVDDDYEKQPAFSKRKRNKRKRKRATQDEPITRGHLQALRMKEQQNIVDESDNDDEYYEKMLAARRKSKREERDRIAKQILERVHHSDSDNEQKSAIVFSEMEQVSVEATPDDNDQNKKHSADFSSGVLKTAGESERHSTVQADHERKQEPATTKPVRTTPSAMNVSDSAPTVAEVNPSSETNGMTGLAATLKRLRQTGVLHRKPEQIGRARDERYSDSEDESVGDGKPRVKLHYTDEFGNKLTPKEAYRLLSHKFHGNAPKQNKREKRLQRMLEEKHHAS
ncbi:SART-1 [Gracilaria domingensis]|nr:SART-1 [Gracilaria domingensis]